ncbi:MAG: SIS domain-containing protein [Planctomycetota bacterium]|nr:SIS domain-containing protein [Planctomycetota bacterium]
MPPSDPSHILDASLVAAQGVLADLCANRSLRQAISRTGQTLGAAYNAGAKSIICGNGGSLCDAVHFAEELTGRFRNDRRPLPAMAISEPGHLTCTANDYGFDQVFARGVEAFGKPGDVLIVLSTSGNSPNCLNAASAGRSRGMTVIGLIGKGGGKLASMCDEPIVVPGETSDRIQELHMLILHTWVEMIEASLPA